MHMGAEPVGWSQVLEDVLRGNATESAVLGFLFKVWLPAKELSVIAFPLHTTRPVMA